jgi:hypothetical protein
LLGLSHQLMIARIQGARNEKALLGLFSFGASNCYTMQDNQNPLSCPSNTRMLD